MFKLAATAVILLILSCAGTSRNEKLYSSAELSNIFQQHADSTETKNN